MCAAELKCVLSVFLLLLLSTAGQVFSAKNTKCIKSNDYFGIENSLLNRSQNLVNLYQAFFPTNRQASIIVEVTYCFAETGSDTKCNGTSAATARYRWLDSPVTMLIRSDLLHFLSLAMYDVEIRRTNVILDRICDFKQPTISTDNPNYYCRPQNSTAHHLLNNLTVNVST